MIVHKQVSYRTWRWHLEYLIFFATLWGETTNVPLKMAFGWDVIFTLAVVPDPVAFRACVERRGEEPCCLLINIPLYQGDATSEQTNCYWAHLLTIRLLWLLRIYSGERLAQPLACIVWKGQRGGIIFCLGYFHFVFQSLQVVLPMFFLRFRPGVSHTLYSVPNSHIFGISLWVL